MSKSSRTITSDIGRPLRIRIARWLIARECRRQHRLLGRDSEVSISIGHAIIAEDEPDD